LARKLHYSYQDAEQAGFFGAVRAADKFDPSFGVPFAGYAQLWVKAFVRDRVYEDEQQSSQPANTVTHHHIRGEELITFRGARQDRSPRVHQAHLDEADHRGHMAVLGDQTDVDRADYLAHLWEVVDQVLVEGFSSSRYGAPDPGRLARARAIAHTWFDPDGVGTRELAETFGQSRQALDIEQEKMRTLVRQTLASHTWGLR
jgi:hypothetical protein